LNKVDCGYDDCRGEDPGKDVRDDSMMVVVVVVVVVVVSSLTIPLPPSEMTISNYM